MWGTAPIHALQGMKKGTEKFCPLDVWWWVVFAVKLYIPVLACSVVVESERAEKGLPLFDPSCFC